MDDLLYYVNYQIQKTLSPTCESGLASFTITLMFQVSKATNEAVIEDVCHMYL